MGRCPSLIRRSETIQRMGCFLPCVPQVLKQSYKDSHFGWITELGCFKKQCFSTPIKQGIKNTVNHHNTLHASVQANNHISNSYPSLVFFFFLVSSDLIRNVCYFSYKVPNLHALLSKLSDVAPDHRKRSAVQPVRKNKVQGCPLLYTCTQVAGTTSFTQKLSRARAHLVFCDA